MAFLLYETLQCEIILKQIETTDFYTPHFVIFKIRALFGAAGPRAASESETGMMAALVGSSVFQTRTNSHSHSA